MPLQRFRPRSGRCKLCSGEVEISIAGEAPDQMECPQCGQSVERSPNLVATPAKILKKPSVSNAKAAGFKVLKRVDENAFETL